MATEDFRCSECGTERDTDYDVCGACGAPPAGSDPRGSEQAIRTTDLEPYVTLRYIAKLFKLLAALMVLMLIGETVTGLMTQGRDSIITLVGEATRFLVLAGLLWAAGDLAILLVDLGHDIRVSRILLGRINAEFHRSGVPRKPGVDQRTTPR